MYILNCSQLVQIYLVPKFLNKLHLVIIQCNILLVNYIEKIITIVCNKIHDHTALQGVLFPIFLYIHLNSAHQYPYSNRFLVFAFRRTHTHHIQIVFFFHTMFNSNRIMYFNKSRTISSLIE